MGNAGRSPGAGTAPRILVVDDDRDILGFVSLALEAHGYAVQTAGDGAEALHLLEQASVDLILLDLNMPVMNGWSFCNEKRHRPALAPIPLALMSAADSLRARVEPCTPSALLPKPFAIDQLLRAVETALAS